MRAKRKTTRRRLVRGKDWHGWAFYFNHFLDIEPFWGQWAEVEPPDTKPSPGGRWVRVKFVPVDSLPKRRRR